MCLTIFWYVSGSLFDYFLVCCACFGCFCLNLFGTSFRRLNIFLGRWMLWDAFFWGLWRSQAAGLRCFLVTSSVPPFGLAFGFFSLALFFFYFLAILAVVWLFFGYLKFICFFWLSLAFGCFIRC